jgi:23S rRNA (cytosine1962-C5)-methyltransferase
MNTQLKTSKRELHPASYRHLISGHPWVIKDKFTDSFGVKDRLIQCVCKKTGNEFLLITDTAHPKIKARLWSHPEEPESLSPEAFFAVLRERLIDAIGDRVSLIQENKREDMFLVFGEADFLPGLFLMRLNEGLIIQSYCGFWKKIQKELIPLIKEVLAELGLAEMISWISWQERNDQKNSPLKPIFGKMPETAEIKEFGVTYKAKFDSGYDLGLYPDMAAIRERFAKSMKAKKVLNLYAYTGAWSLFSLSNGAKHVTSVDLSEKYISWLEENLSMNLEHFSGEHQSITSSVSGALRRLEKNEAGSFDFIISDPPSFSSDGKKTSNSLKSNENHMSSMSQLLNKNGELIVFVNTHALSWKKVKESLVVAGKKNKLRMIGSLNLSSDCPTLSSFPEGEYLKGIHFKKI